MATRNEQDGPAAPRLHPPALGPLIAVPESLAVDGEDDLDEVAIRDLAADELTWTGRRRFGSSLLSGVTARAWAAPGASLVARCSNGSNWWP